MRFWSPCSRAALVCSLLLGLQGPALADPAALRERHEALRDALRGSPFGRPLHLESRQMGESLQGDVYAVLDHSFEKVRDALAQPANWCDVMILPFNTKYCHAVQADGGPALMVRIGRRYDQPVEHAFRLQFDHRLVAASPRYFECRLSAQEGPVGTRDYRIVVSAIPLDGGRTFLHLGYAYGFGTMGRIAMHAYLATAGADKVGFTRVNNGAGGHGLIGGMRGAVERNAMRYYLAIDTFLDSLDAPPAQRAERRIQGWFDATERYPLQLREMDRRTYVSMKRMEVERQQTLLP
ncbi:hypothetical protein JI739_18510 [Ramlibacter sp. AW1]|uniref:Uncharacterized protein n=1 Tax=Ramlibacter aurantiacus TaxID=2801330 RepID=A0A937D6I6_9BURK|nr:hypothetical protein [Ramlibacter aurantiacus]MBL0422347.1 hypothetical protein [Ramlibacter aurantiacus]